MLTADDFPEAMSPRKRGGKTKVKRALRLKRRSEELDVESATMLKLTSKCWFLQGLSHLHWLLPRAFQE